MPVLAPTVPSSSNRRDQVIWARLRLGHTRLTHRHLLLGEPPPYCEKCNISLSLEVSEELGIALSVFSRLWQRFQDDGNVSKCYSTGRPRVTTPNEVRYLAVTAKINRRSTSSDLSRQLSSTTGTTVSSQTVYRRLRHIGPYARRPDRCVPLTATHCHLE
ncbi:HTH_Tnp_Tc3_2 domain-containing protein [Trichonephila clavipes]|nr:HTH_Tnp_Tc3_2 domain-containing protein [Trichonephila clavipes]